MRTWGINLAVGLLIVTNIITGWSLFSTTREAKEQARRDARHAVGQIHETLWDLQAHAETGARDRLLGAVLKLQFAYQTLYDLELSGDIPAGGRRWSTTLNVLLGPIQQALVTGDAAELPVMRTRLERLIALVPLQEKEPLVQLRERLDQVEAVFR